MIFPCANRPPARYLGRQPNQNVRPAGRGENANGECDRSNAAADRGPAGRADRRGSRAGLSHQAGAADHSVPARRQQRRGRPADRHATEREARQAGGGRKPRRRRRRRGGHRGRSRTRRTTATRSASSRSRTPSIPGSTSCPTIRSSRSRRSRSWPPARTCWWSIRRCRSTRCRNCSQPPRPSPARCNMPRPASAASSISAANCSS